MLKHPFGYVDAPAQQRLASLTANLKEHILSTLRLRPYHRVLDAGCGLGADTITMARLVTARGLVVGIDNDPAMVQKARISARRVGVNKWVRHELADVHSIPYASCFFDACRSERLFQHVRDGLGALKELVRVTKPGGRVLVADTDWCTLSIDTPEKDAERQLVRFIADSLPNGRAGRELLGLFRQTALEDVRVSAWPLVWTQYDLFRHTSFAIRSLNTHLAERGVLSTAQLSRLTASFRRAERGHAFFASGTIVIVTGLKRHLPS